MTEFKHTVEYILLWLLLWVCSLLPVYDSSNLGGYIGRTIGPRLAASRKALANLQRAFPESTAAERHEVLVEMWENLGRVIAEYPHLEQIGARRTTVIDEQILKDAFAAGKGGVLIGAHQANWEVSATAMLARYKQAPHLTYRAPNNPAVGRLLQRFRTLKGRIKAYPKNRSSMKDMMATLRDKKFLGVLIDQKYNEGVAVDFFGRPAMTNPAAVVFAQKYNVPLIMALARRVEKTKFEIKVFGPIATMGETGALPVESVLAEIHKILEDWIKENPGEWLWLHRRWDSAKLKQKIN